MFGVLHQPRQSVDCKNAGWLICSAFGEERNQSQRHMVEWARALCREGFWVLRFDYRGYGDSNGLFEEHPIEHYLEDIEMAVTELEKRSGVPCRGLCGLRLGATLAALAGTCHVREPMLLLWEPVVSGEDYVDELLRFVISQQMKENGQAEVTRESLRQTLTEGGEVTILGHTITKPIFDSLRAIDLTAPLPAKTGPIRIVRIANRAQSKMPKPLDALRDAWVKTGADVCLEPARSPLPWYAATREYDVRPAKLFEPTIEWIRAHYSDTCAHNVLPSGEPSSTKHTGPIWCERAVEFDIDGTATWGILNTPAERHPERPVVLMLSVAENCRATDARFYVKLARELARQGYTSLRVDPRGVGDSGGIIEADTVPNLYLQIQNGLFVRDTQVAIDFLQRELGTETVVLTGICGGAISSVLWGAQDKRVVGVAPLELTLLYETQPGLAEVSQESRRLLQKLVLAWQPTTTRRITQTFLTALKSRYGSLKCKLQGVKDVQPLAAPLGPRANTAVLAALLELAQRNVPTLAIFGDTFGAGAFKDIEPTLRAAFGSAASKLQYHKVEKADHLFTTPPHTQEVFQTLTDWLKQL